MKACHLCGHFMREEDPGDICEKCKAVPQTDLKEGEDFYINEKGLFVFKTEYHLKRGYCCESGCKHCPY